MGVLFHSQASRSQTIASALGALAMLVPASLTVTIGVRRIDLLELDAASLEDVPAEALVPPGGGDHEGEAEDPLHSRLLPLIVLGLSSPGEEGGDCASGSGEEGE